MINITKAIKAKIKPIIVIITIGLCQVIWLVMIVVLNDPVIRKLVNGSKINQFRTKKMIASSVKGINTQLIHNNCRISVHWATKVTTDINFNYLQLNQKLNQQSIIWMVIKLKLLHQHYHQLNNLMRFLCHD